MIILNPYFAHARCKKLILLLDSKMILQVHEHPDGYSIVYSSIAGVEFRHCVKESLEDILELIREEEDYSEHPELKREDS